MHPRSRTVVAAAVGVALSCALAAAQAPPRSTNDGVYTTAQAERGKATFEAKCSACHETSRFKGNDFVSGWANGPLFGLYEMISATMPADNPGGLQQQEYADVIALMLQLNGVRAGDAELKAGKDAMSAIRFDPPPVP